MNPALRRLIVQRGLLGKTNAEIAAALNTKSERITFSENITSAGIITALGPDLTREALAGLEAAAQRDPLLRSQMAKINSTGIDFSHPVTLQFIDQLQAAGVFQANVADALRSLGVQYKSPYELWAGDGQVVTEEQVADALAEPVSPPEKRIYVALSIGAGHRNLYVRAANVIEGMEVETAYSYGVQGQMQWGVPTEKASIIEQILTLAEQL